MAVGSIAPRHQSSKRCQSFGVLSNRFMAIDRRVWELSCTDKLVNKQEQPKENSDVAASDVLSL